MTEITDETLAAFAAALNRQTDIAVKADDGGRSAAAKDAQADIARAMSAASESKADLEAKALRAELAQVREEMKAALLSVRQPSVAAQVGQGGRAMDRSAAMFDGLASPALKASLGPDYRGGDLLRGLTELGMLNGKLSALRWVLGSEWDFLDT